MSRRVITEHASKRRPTRSRQSFTVATWIPPQRPIGPGLYGWFSRLWSSVVVLLLLVLHRRFALDAKVGRAASWSVKPELVEAFEARPRSADPPPGHAEVKVLARHRKRLSPFVIEYILRLPLRAYELSDHEELALRRLLLDSAGKGPGLITPLVRHAAQLVRYANRAALWDLGTTKELLSPAHLTQFMDWYQRQITEDSYNEARRFLVKAALTVSPEKEKTYGQVPEGRRQRWSAPTSEEDLQAQWEQACAYPVERVRRLLLALICLSRGAGLRAEELRFVRGRDVVPRKRGGAVVRVLVGNNKRDVVVIGRFAAVLRVLAAACGDELMLELGAGDRGVMEPLRKLATSWDSSLAPFPNPNQLANAYFLEVAQRRVRACTILRVLAGNTIRGLEDLRPYMEDNPGGPPDDLEGREDTDIPYFSPPLESL